MRDLARRVSAARRLTIVTGAGVSSASGVPTFRGPQGLWKSFRPEDLATPEAFSRDPRLVWEWYDWRRTVIRDAQPNAGHLALAELQRRKAPANPAAQTSGGGNARSASPRDPENGFTLITQNVDGLHDRAGSRNTIKLHGDIWQVRCVGCGFATRNEQAPLDHLPPRCSCGALLRPGVVWFGESLPAGEWE